MLCTDVEIPAEAPEQAFVRAWNLIVEQRSHYTAVFEHIASESDNLLLKYRAQEMLCLLNEGRMLEAFDYELSLKVLDHIEVRDDGRLDVMFLAGMEVAF